MIFTCCVAVEASTHTGHQDGESVKPKKTNLQGLKGSHQDHLHRWTQFFITIIVVGLRVIPHSWKQANKLTS